jgi:hypothetical protein
MVGTIPLRILLVMTVALLCTACTRTAYEPSVGRLTNAAGVIGPLVSDEAAVLRREYRSSLLNATPGHAPASLSKFVCEPLGYTAESIGSSGELSGFGNAASTIAIAPRPSGWLDGIAALFRSYDLPAPRPKDAMKEARVDAFTTCMADINGMQGVDTFLVSRVGSTMTAGGRSMSDSVSGIMEIVEPAVAEALAVVDDHRRAAALRDFFSDKNKVSLLREHIVVLQNFFQVMDQYRRLRAMEAVGKASAAATFDGDRMISAATHYDTAYASQMRPAFVDMLDSVDSLERIANGEDEAALIFSANAASWRTLRALQGLQELATDTQKKERLQRMINNLSGRPERH